MMHRLAMRRLIAAVLSAGLIAAGCAGLTGGGFATNDELRGPWRPEPFSVDPSTITAAEQFCGAPGIGGGMVQGGRLVAVDARGGSRLTLLFAGVGADSSQCDLRIVASGTFAIIGTSASTSSGPADFIAPNDVIIVGGGQMRGIGAEEWSSVVGRTGPSITAVRVGFESGSSLGASVGGGWFAAWWPTTQTNFVVQGFDASGRKVGEVKQ
jgi:hypothetical protein